MQIADFVEKWNNSGAAERANKDSYLRDLCDVLGVPHPDPTTGDAERDRYVFEKDAPFQVEGGNVSIRKIDLYKAGCFILEAKQGSEQGALKLGTARRGTPPWHWEMQKAYGQALGYARSFDRPPPFLIVADLGFCFDLFASFDGSHAYAPFPAAQTSRIHVKDLAAHVDTLKAVFTDPLSLDPSRRSIAVTREVAAHLAELKRALDKDKHAPEEIAKFLMRCLFTMFAEDVGLLPERIFTDAVEKLWLESPKSFPGGIESLWRAMNDGTSFGFVGKLLKFNGGLFKSPTALPLDVKQLKLLLEAAKCDWSEVEPAIFGTLLERALDAKERHALGAHFTPRAYVERLVRPTIEELRDYGNIECRDAVLAYDSQELRRNDDGKPVTRWDGETMMTNPVTGELVPDDRFTTPAYDFIKPRKAEWPQVDFIVGNPPFIGKARRRAALGDGYLEALCAAYPEMPEGADYVAWWWHVAAGKVIAGTARQFGFITTKSMSQSLNRKILSSAMADGLRLRFAIPNHPWVDSDSGAAVRIAMTVGTMDRAAPAMLLEVVSESPSAGDGAVAVELVARSVTEIQSDLRDGAAITTALPLRANLGLASVGVVLFGKGFLVSDVDAQQVEATALRTFLNGRDLMQTGRGMLVIDLYPMTEEQALAAAPRAMQVLLNRVKPERDQIRDPGSRRAWWRFGRDKPDLRSAIASLKRYIVSPEVSKHRVFAFIDSSVLPDHKLVGVATDNAFVLGVLSSKIHAVWSAASGGRHGVGDDLVYNRSRCFDPFPFPDASPQQVERAAALAEGIDAHRKRYQAEHADLTLTGMYNVIESLRLGTALSVKDKSIHERGVVSVLKKLHDDLDTVIFQAYGWPADLSEDQILESLVALNAERAEEERQGRVRWLRPDLQDTAATKPMMQVALIGEDVQPEVVSAVIPTSPWPKKLPEQIAGLRDLVLRSPSTWTAKQAASAFKGAKPHDVEPVLESLAALGLLVSWSSGAERQWKAARA